MSHFTFKSALAGLILAGTFTATAVPGAAHAAPRRGARGPPRGARGPREWRYPSRRLCRHSTGYRDPQYLHLPPGGRRLLVLWHIVRSRWHQDMLLKLHPPHEVSQRHS